MSDQMSKKSSKDTESHVFNAHKNKIWREKNIIHFLIADEVNPGDAKYLKDKGVSHIDTILAEYPQKKVLVIIDIQKASIFSSQARKSWAEFLQNTNIHRTAIFGGNVIVKTIASFIIGASQMKNVQYFRTKQDALHWLRN